jgi:cellulose synthase/poly-beta-1,6-N-acetylglucosamine synthase-like glycosyltransferase
MRLVQKGCCVGRRRVMKSLFFASAFLIVWLLLFLLTVIALYVLFLKEKPKKVPLSQLPPVSIVRPLKGVDAFLEENLISCLDFDYPNYEVIVSVASEDDPALEMAQSVRARYPKADFTIIVGKDSAYSS